MKKVIVFFYQVDSREAVEFIVNDLRQAFDELVEFPVIYLDDFRKLGFKQGDQIRTRIYCDDGLIFDQLLPYYDSFGKAEEKSIMIYNNELNKMALAEVCGDLCTEHGLGYGSNYKVVFSYE